MRKRNILGTSNVPLFKYASLKMLGRQGQNPAHWPPQANSGNLTIFCARGVGNLTFACMGWGKLNQKNQVSNIFLGGGTKVANSHKTCVWTRWNSLKQEI